MRFRTATIGLVLLGVAWGSAALTLGRARGAAWIGQPLELAVSTQLEAGQSANGLCAEADVFYADTKVDSSRVLVSVETTAQADSAIIRIISPVLVDEPVVTVYVRAGCTAKTTRRFVMLADFPSDTVAAPVRTPEAPQIPTIASVAAPTISPAAQPSAPPAPTAMAPTVAAPLKQDTAPRAAPAAAAAAQPRKVPRASTEPRPPTEPKAPASGRARLKLDPLENLAERIKTLEATTSAAPVEEMVREAQRSQQLQGDIKALLAQAAKNEAALLAMRERLERAESDRVPGWLLYALLALVAACAAAIAVLWNRRDPSAWRSGLAAPLGAAVAPAASVVASADLDGDDETKAPATLAGNGAATGLKPQGRPGHGDLLDMDSRMFESYVTVNVPLVASDSQIMEFGRVAQAHPNFNSAEMFDVRQKAEFFSKLGKTNEAIEVLEQRIRDNSKDCPLIFLELLRIANLHSLKTDFRQFRDELTTVFNVNVPEFALFRDEGRGLEAFPACCRTLPNCGPRPRSWT